MRICGHDVLVVKPRGIDISGETGEKGAMAYGLFEGGVPQITIAVDLGYQGRERRASTLLHETVHAINTLGGLDNMFDNGNTEENYTARLTGSLLAWMRDNPGAVAYIMERTTR